MTTASTVMSTDRNNSNISANSWMLFQDGDDEHALQLALADQVALLEACQYERDLRLAAEESRRDEERRQQRMIMAGLDVHEHVHEQPQHRVPPPSAPLTVVPPVGTNTPAPRSQGPPRRRPAPVDHSSQTQPRAPNRQRHVTFRTQQTRTRPVSEPRPSQRSLVAPPAQRPISTGRATRQAPPDIVDPPVTRERRSRGMPSQSQLRTGDLGEDPWRPTTSSELRHEQRLQQRVEHRLTQVQQMLHAHPDPALQQRPGAVHVQAPAAPPDKKPTEEMERAVHTLIRQQQQQDEHKKRKKFHFRLPKWKPRHGTAAPSNQRTIPQPPKTAPPRLQQQRGALLVPPTIPSGNQATRASTPLRNQDTTATPAVHRRRRSLPEDLVPDVPPPKPRTTRAVHVPLRTQVTTVTRVPAVPSAPTKPVVQPTAATTSAPTSHPQRTSKPLVVAHFGIPESPPGFTNPPQEAFLHNFKVQETLLAESAKKKKKKQDIKALPTPKWTSRHMTTVKIGDTHRGRPQLRTKMAAPQPRGGRADSSPEPPPRNQRPLIFTCQCCFDECQLDQRVYCCQGQHAFCHDCVRRYGQVSVVEDKDNLKLLDGEYRLPCLSSDSCPGGYLDEQVLQQTFAPQLYQLYQQLQTQKMIQAAGVTLQTCIHCGFQIDNPNNEFECPSCGKTQEPEPPKTAQHAIEEALTDAKVRTCPVCSTKFLRESDTCNKMKCPTCGTRMCYICRQVVPAQGYDHFDNSGLPSYLRRNNKCPLWTSTKQQAKQDQELLQQRGFRVANQVWEENLLNGGGEPTENPHAYLQQLL